MKRNSAWNDVEIKDAVKAYFSLIESQKNFEPVNKSAIYRKLSELHPVRSAKAFELKFQNISAVLYEEKLAYADGLRPLSNYQSALKAVVLEYLSKNNPDKQAPINILVDKLKRLHCRDYLPVHGKGSGKYGLTLEYYLSIPQNSSKEADFMGIELKTKHGNTLQTLFSRKPSRYLSCKDKTQLISKFGYLDKKRNRKALYTSFNNVPDSLGFYLSPMETKIVINKKQYKVLEYDGNVLEEALLLKHNETAYITVGISRLKSGKTGCRFDQLLYCKTPTLSKFMRMAHDGNVYFDFTLSEMNGRVKDHGFLWRVPQEAIGDLYTKSKLINLSVK